MEKKEREVRKQEVDWDSMRAKASHATAKEIEGKVEEKLRSFENRVIGQMQSFGKKYRENRYIWEDEVPLNDGGTQRVWKSPETRRREAKEAWEARQRMLEEDH